MNSINSPANRREPRVPLVVMVEKEVRWALREVAIRRRMSVSDMVRLKINELLAAPGPVGAEDGDV